MRGTVRLNRSRRLIACCNPSPVERRQMRALLQRAGYACVMYESPRELIDNINIAVPRIVLFDADELGIARFSACRQIRDRHPDLQAPIMVLSASCDRYDVDRARDAGAQDYLIKPVSGESLIRRLDHWSGVRIPCRPAAHPISA